MFEFAEVEERSDSRIAEEGDNLWIAVVAKVDKGAFAAERKLECFNRFAEEGENVQVFADDIRCVIAFLEEGEKEMVSPDPWRGRRSWIIDGVIVALDELGEEGETET